MVQFHFIPRRTQKSKYTKAIALVFGSILGHSKGAYFRFLRADLVEIVFLLNSPFLALLDSTISFQSETQQKIEKHLGYIGVLVDFGSF